MYKQHPRQAQIQAEKQRLEQMLAQVRLKQQRILAQLKQERSSYLQENKQQIEKKLSAIYEAKLQKRNRIRQEDATRAERIADRRAQLLMQIIPERRQLIESLRQQCLQELNGQDQRRKAYLQSHIQQKIRAQNQVLLESSLSLRLQRISKHGLIDPNDGICVICLSSPASIYMINCKHIICCGDCEFMVRMNRKCPLCRAMSGHANISDLGKSAKSKTKTISK